MVMIALLSVLSCATKKSRKDTTFLGKVYHNTTAKYNGYFNADEIMTASYLSLENSNKDNYNQRLGIFAFKGGDGDGVKSELDRAIEKVSIVAASHPQSHWRDDCYLLVGEAQFMQKDYESAEETLEYFAEEFDPLKKTRKKSKRQRAEASDEAQVDKEKERREKIKDRKKSKRSNKRMTREERAREEAKKEAEKAKAEAEKKAEAAKEAAKEEDTEGYFMKHRPVYEDGLVWLAHTYLVNDKYSLSRSYLRRVEESKGLHKDIKGMLYAVKAEYYLEEENPAQAAVELERAYVWEDDKQKKARYAFIMGQLMEEVDQYAAASEYFDRVIGLRPNYDMVFNAKLKMMTNSIAAGTMTMADLEKEIEKLLRDEKNKDYEDQLYTALAKVAFASGDEAKGIEYLKIAVGKGEKTSVYKTDAYYQIAEYYFNNEDFVDAKLYYDSTLTAMAKEDVRRPKVELLSTNLAAIAEQITIISTQDSLLALSQLSKEELLAKAEDLQEKLEEEEEDASQGAGSFDGFKAAQSIRPAGPGGASFFAYDPLLKDKGFRDFKNDWGDRPLEDNWRRSQKSFSAFAEEEEEERQQNNDQEVASSDDQLIEKFFSDVPTTPEEKANVLKAKENALFSLGKLYRDNMQNCDKSIQTLNQLITEFPSTEHEKDALFYLYLCANELDKNAAKSQYANTLIKKYPESLYAQSIQDPDFMKKQNDAKNELERYYQETYDLLQMGEYTLVRSRLDEVNQLFSNRGALTAKFALLSAMMAGQQNGKESYIVALQDVIAKHKDTPEATRAREIMRFLQGDKDAFAISGDGQLVDTKFKLEDEKLHYVFAVVHDLNGASMTDVKISVSEYNRRFHRTDKLSLSTLDLDIENSTPLLLVRKFKNKEEAMKYYDGIQKRLDKFIPKKVQFEVFAVSQYNYREVIKERSVKTYRTFFNNQYLTQ